MIKIIQWKNVKRKDTEDIDITSILSGGKIEDDGTIILDFGSEPQEKEKEDPSIIILNAYDMTYCSLYCPTCNCYHCKLEGV